MNAKSKPIQATEPYKHPGEWVRAKHPKSGAHYTTTRALANKAGAEILDGHDAVDRYGKPLPTKPRVELTKENKK